MNTDKNTQNTVWASVQNSTDIANTMLLSENGTAASQRMMQQAYSFIHVTMIFTLVVGSYLFSSV